MAILFLDLAGTLVDLDAYQRGQAEDLCFLTPSLYKELKTVDCVLVTASPQVQVHAVMKLTGLDQVIAWKALITAEQGGDQKASGEPFKEYLSIHHDKAIHVGDSNVDEEGARKVGIPFVRVSKEKTFSLQREALTKAVTEALRYLGVE
jgi:phosphoglycolate phosphatase-like HAD superfamily hydrolase